MSINDELRNKNTQEQIFNFQFRNKSVKNVLEVMQKIEQDLRLKVLSIDGETLTKKRSKKILKWAAKSNKILKQLVTATTEEDFKNLISNELEFQNDTIQSSLPSDINIETTIPTIDSVWKTANARPYEAKKMSQWFDSWSTENKQIVENTVKAGVIKGQTLQQMTRELFGTRANNYKDGKLQRSRSQIQTIVRTTNSHILNTTKESFYQENEDIVKGYQWVSTLDSRTTLICINLDGKKDLYDGSVTELNGEVPPSHFGCRSTTTPILKSWKELGFDKDELSESTRASMNGQVAETINYPEWLNKQSAKFQKSVLGPTRYKAWKNGDIKINQFTDNKNNILTIDQLKSKGLEINGK